ncbi:LemA family protein [Candidatus Woesearchaeota archaeon]|nr:LemA family protein [Candidatus Woesearchaeota archaeon]
MLWLWIILALILVYIIIAYNSLVVKRNRVKNAWSQIDVQLKRRADLIPNLVETVKGYMKHEREVLENITKARAALQQAKTVKDKAKADNVIAGALKTLFAVAENYPNLKANENFLQLQEELSGIESKIAYARQFYNDSVLDYNNSIKIFPKNIIASIFGFKPEEFFNIPEEERKLVKVKF